MQHHHTSFKLKFTVMKRTVISGVAVILLNWITYTTHAQFAHSVAKFDSAASFTYNKPSMPGEVKNFKYVNTKSVKRFTETYKNATDIKWSLLKYGRLMVHFFNDGIQTRIFYNKNGSQAAMIRYYTEDKLPNEVRHLVKTNYYDFNIFLVIEVTVGDQIAYLVKIEDKICTKTIRVMNGEMNVMEDFVKL